MLYWNNLKENKYYVIDLLQWSDGQRAIKFREVSEASEEHAVMSTDAYLGKDLRKIMSELGFSGRVPIRGGGEFVLDAHGAWMTLEEVNSWRTNPTQAALDDPNAPWVNHRPPKFAEK